VIRQVDDGAVEGIRDHRTRGTACLPIFPKHEVVDEELRSSSEEVCQRRAPFVGFKLILLVDANPRQLLPPSRQLVAAPRQFLLCLEKLEPRCKPLFTCSRHVFCHRSRLLPAQIYFHSPRLARLRRVNISTHIPAVSFCPAAHAFEWRDDCPPQLGQGILDSDGPGACHAPRDEPCGFEIAKRLGKHALRDASEMAAQLPVSMRPSFETKQNLRCPPANKDRRGTLRSLCFVHVCRLVIKRN
jgi:hypothetical protein